MKMLKVLGKVVKYYLVIDTVISVVALTDYYVLTKGWKVDHDKAQYWYNPVTKLYMKAFDYKAHKLGLTIDESTDEEDHLDILNIEEATKMMA